MVFQWWKTKFFSIKWAFFDFFSKNAVFLVKKQFFHCFPSIVIFGDHNVWSSNNSRWSRSFPLKWEKRSINSPSSAHRQTKALPNKLFFSFFLNIFKGLTKIFHFLERVVSSFLPTKIIVGIMLGKYEHQSIIHTF